MARGIQPKLDEFMASREEHVVQVIAESGGIIRLRGEWEDGECLRVFGVRAEELREILDGLRRQGVVRYAVYSRCRAEPHTTISLTRRFRCLLLACSQPRGMPR